MMSNEIIQKIEAYLNLFGVCNLFFRLTVCFIGIVSLFNLYKYLKERDSNIKELRYKIFITDGWCLFKQLCGYYLFIVVSYLFLYLETKYKVFLHGIIKPLLLAASSFIISLTMTKHTASLEEYYGQNN